MKKYVGKLTKCQNVLDKFLFELTRNEIGWKLCILTQLAARGVWRRFKCYYSFNVVNHIKRKYSFTNREK